MPLFIFKDLMLTRIMSLCAEGERDTGCFKDVLACSVIESKKSLISLFKRQQNNNRKKKWQLLGRVGFPRAWISHPEHNRWGKQINKISSNCNERIQTDCSFRVRSLSIKRRHRALPSPLKVAGNLNIQHSDLEMRFINYYRCLTPRILLMFLSSKY